MVFLLIVPVMAFGPLEIVSCINQYSVLILIMVALVVLWKYKSRIIFLITGDDRLHGNGLDFTWFLCRKCFGVFPNDCFCFGVNMKKQFGRSIGLASTPLRILNLRAGDLPFSGRGDFYLCIECGDHPPITTSVVEDAEPKVVHFLEPINIRLRDNIFEHPLRFVIKEEDVFGSKSLCEFSIEAKMVFDQLDAAKADFGETFVMRRYKMDVLVPGYIAETPPWIIMEMTTEMDNSLEDVHENPYNHTTALMTRPFLKNGGGTTVVYEKFSPEDLKRNFELVDGQGRVAMEPDEGDLESLRRFKRRKLHENYLFFLVLFAIIAGYSMFRFYIWSCFSQFENLTVGMDLKMELPFGQRTLEYIAKDCGKKIVQTKPECFPSHTKVEEHCKTIPEKYLPRAFSHLWYELAGWRSPWLTVTCAAWTCPVHAQLDANDFKIFLLIVLILGFYGLHYTHVRDQIKAMNKKMAEKMAHNLRGNTQTAATMRGECYSKTFALHNTRRAEAYDANGYNQGYAPLQQHIH